MRILYVLTSLGMGGAEKLTLALCERMQMRGHEVALLVLKPKIRDEWPASLPKLHLDIHRSPLSFARGLARARQFASEYQPDLVHSHSFHANILARLLKLREPRPPVISTIHNVYEGGYPRMLVYRLTDNLSRRTVAVSKAAAQRFIRLKTVPSRKCCVIANGIDISHFVPSDGRRARMRLELNVASDPEEDFIWLAAGRISRAKDYPNLLHAFSTVHAVRRKTCLWIAGDGAGSQLGVLQSIANHLGLSDSIRWLGLRRDMPALLNAADAFVSSSAWEGMPLSIGEAMAMQKPVVATDVGGVHELVGDAAVIVPSRDPEALAEAMLGVMRQSGEERRALGAAARERVVRHFGMDANADHWEALYHDTIAQTCAVRS